MGNCLMAVRSIHRYGNKLADDWIDIHEID